MSFIGVIDQHGQESKVDAHVGETLMEILRDNLFDVSAICSGAGTCGTCHLHIEDYWFKQLPERDCYEEDTLSQSLHYEPNKSRLACQIDFAEALNGIRVILVNED